MSEIIIPGLYLLSGICVYAAAKHLAAGLYKSFDLIQVMFSGLCILVVAFSIAHLHTMQATDIGSYVSALRWNLSFVILFFILFPWFIAQYTGRRSLFFLLGLSALFALLFVANFMQIYTIQYAEISSLKTLQMPWGEGVTRAVGRNSVWARVAIAGVLLTFGYAFYALGRAYRKGHCISCMPMMFAIGLLLVAAIEGILARLSIIDFIETGPFGYLGMIIVMSIVLNRENQRRLRDSENRFRSLVENTPDAVARYDKNCHRIYANPSMQADAGIPLEDLLNKTPEEFPGGEMSVAYQARMRQVLESGEPADFELNWRSGDGRDHNFHIRLVPEYDAEGKVVTVLGVGRNIAERKHYIQELQRWHDIFEHAEWGVIIGNAERNTLELVNPAFARMHGYSVEELTGRPIADVFAPQSREDLSEQIRLAHEKGHHSYESVHLRKDGTTFPVYIDVTVVRGTNGEVLHRIANVQDITERNQMQEELYSQEQMFRAIAENSPNPIIRYDSECRRLYVNPAVVKLLGKPVEELVGSTPADEAILFSEQDRRLMQAIRQVFADGETLHVELDIVGHDGQSRDIETLLVPERDVEGKVQTVLGLSHDITAIRTVERRLTNFMANVPGFFFSFRQSPEGSFSFPFASPGIRDMYGLSPEDVRDDMRPLHVLTHPDDQPRVLEAIAESARLNTPFHVEFRMQPAGRPERWIESRSMPEREADGGILWHGIMLDVTERKRAEEELRRSEERYRQLYTKTPVMLHSINEHGVMVNVSDYWLSNMGYRHEEVIGRKSTEFLTEASRRYAEEVVLPAFMQTGICTNIHYQFVKKDGSLMDGQLSAIAERDEDGRIIHSLAVIEDVTERKKAEIALRESEEKYRTLIQKIQAGVVVHGSDTKIITSNHAAQEILGLSEDQMLGKTAIDPAWHFISEDNTPLSPEAYPVNKVLASAKPLRDYVVGVQRPGQENDVWVLVNADPVFDKRGDISQVIVTFIDITPRKEAQEAVATREREFRTLAEHLPDKITRYDREGRLLYLNPSLEQFLGTTASERMGKTVREWHRDGSYEKYAQTLDHVLASGEESEIEMTVHGPEGETLEVHQIRMVAERDEQGDIAGVLAIGHEITALKQAEEGLENTQAELRELATRIETMREEERRHIARELHDELGQLLTAIRMGVSHLKLEYEPDDARFQERMQRIVGLVDKTIQHVREVVTMLRPAVLERGIVAALEWLTDEFKAHSGIACELHVNKEKVYLDEERAIAIFRIAQESLTNITRHAGADWVLIELACEDDNCRLKVRDNGKGFDPGQQKKKSLGLVGVRERVLRLGGEVKIDSAPEQGTTIDVFLPLIKGGKNDEPAGQPSAKDDNIH